MMEQSAPRLAPQKVRPLGVTILVILSFIRGAFFILLGLGLDESLLLMLGGAMLVIGWGLWTGQSWAWWAEVILEAFNLLVSLARARIGIIGLPISATILYYLFQPHVKEFFGVKGVPMGAPSGAPAGAPAGVPAGGGTRVVSPGTVTITWPSGETIALTAFLQVGQKVIPISSLPQTFGRSDFIGVAPEEVLRTISRRHFTIDYDPVQRTFVIWDEGSTNGTYLNGVDIRGKGRQPLKDGDIISPANIINIRFSSVRAA